jgi:hypothetical protein
VRLLSIRPKGVPPTEVPEDLREWKETYDMTNAMADLMGCRRDYVVCQICQKHSWRLPPHGLDPCPLAVTAAQSQSLKTDAERNAAILAGQQMAQAVRMMEKHMEQSDDDDE